MGSPSQTVNVFRKGHAPVPAELELPDLIAHLIVLRVGEMETRSVRAATMG